MIKELEDKPQDSSYDEQIKELKAERAAWMSVVAKINDKNVFNFLSDAGLLPNYAFPEAGIVLKAVLTRVEKDENDRQKNKYESTTYEYNRSASSAISEFAPLNSFYAGGHKLTIDQVGVSNISVDRDETAEIIADEYEKLLNQAGVIDYETIIIESTKLLQEKPYVRECIAAKYPWLLIDEYQDLGRPLHEMVLALIDKTKIKFFAVGDPDQSIYREELFLESSRK